MEVNVLIYAGSELVGKINRGSFKEHEQKIKSWMGNSTGNTDKRSTASGKNDKTKKKRWNKLEQKGKGNTRKKWKYNSRK